MARQGQWQLAIRYFRSAHEEAPDNPAALLNLGLAYDRMGGREVVALPWFRAYLAAAPAAANAAQVRGRIAELDTAIEVRIQQIIEIASRIIEELPAPQEKSALISWLMRASAEFGDLNGAQRMEGRLPAGSQPGWGTAHVATLHGRRGNVASALMEAKRLPSPLMRSWTYAEVAVEQAKRRDFIGAFAIIADVQVPKEASYALSRIALLQARSGDAAGAEATTNKIPETEVAPRAIGMASTAVALARAGDAAGANRLLGEAERLHAGIEGFADRVSVQAMTAVVRAALAPGSAPLSAVGGLPDGAARDRALRDIAAARGGVGQSEIFHWASVAHEIEDNAILADVGGAIEASKTKAPNQTGIALATVAYEAARALAKLRE